MLYALTYHRRGYTGIDRGGRLHCMRNENVEEVHWTRSASGSTRRVLATCLRSRTPLTLYRHVGRAPATGAYDAHFDAWHSHAVEHDVPPSSWWVHHPRRAPRPCAPTHAHVLPHVNVLSIDIEVLPTQAGGFPSASLEQCPVVVIACTLASDVLSSHASQSSWRTHVWSLGSCSALGATSVPPHAPGATLRDDFASEALMLADFGAWFRRMSPSVVTGWNVGFDLRYLLERSPQLRHTLSAVPGAACYVDASNNVHVCGRVVADMLHCVRVLLRVRARSYKLKDIASEVLGGTTKDPVEYSQIRSMHLEGGPDARAVLATYCAKDAWLPLAIAAERKAWHQIFALAQKAKLMPQDLLFRGQSARVLSVMQYACYHRKPRLAIPVLKRDASKKRPTYRGALVLDAAPGLHLDAVVCLDFASLYPSIIRAFNVCVSTRRVHAHADDVARALLMSRKVPMAIGQHIAAFLSHGDLIDAVDAFPPDPARWQAVGEDGDYFAKPSWREGVLPSVLGVLYQQRVKIKGLMKQMDAKSMEYVNHDAQQKAVKELMNSFYGTLALEGASVAAWQAARAITGRGRQLLAATKRLAKRLCTFDADVVYGDTDSIMVKMVGATCKQAEREGERLAHVLNSLYFPYPIELEYEKLWEAYLIYKKKAYCGLRNGVFTASGMELVRTDTPPIVADCQRTCAMKALHGCVPDAIAHYREVMQLVRAEYNVERDLQPYVRMATLTKTPSDYASPKPAHVAVAMRVVGSQKGDRIPFVVRAGDEARVADRSLHVSEFKKDIHYIDRPHYSNSIQTAVEPWLRAAAGDDPDLLRALSEASGAARGTTFVHPNAPLASFLNIQSTQRKRVKPPPSQNNHRPKKRQATLSLFAVLD